MKNICSSGLSWILLAFSSCQAIKLSKQSREPNTSLLVINGIYGLHSIDLMLENRETHEKYETKKLPPKEVVNRLKPIFPPGVQPFPIPNF